MANGYLGKISAVVSANTGDFTSKLNQSAKEVGRFAKSVESTLGNASRQAAASLASIYTPLQKFERALQAASTMKLSFSGFAGAIKNVDALKSRLDSLNDRQVAVILKSSGLSSIKALDDALYGLKSKEFDLLVRVGGAEKLKELREQVRAGVGDFKVLADTRDAENNVLELTQRLDEAKKAGAAVDVKVNVAQVRAAKSELKEFVAEQAKSMGLRGKQSADSIREALVSRLATGTAGVERSAGKLSERDRLLQGTPAEAVQARANITSNYSKDEADLKKYRASVEEARESLSQLEALSQRYRSASIGSSSGSNPYLEQLQADLDLAKQKYEELVVASQKKVSEAVGFDVPLKDVDKLLSDVAGRGEVLERVFEQAGAGGSAALQRVLAVLNDLGASDLEATVTQMRQMTSVSEQITKPLGDAQKIVAGLGFEVQGQFLPAMIGTQSAAEALVAAIKSTAAPAGVIEKLFAQTEQRVKATAAAAGRLSEAMALVGKTQTGSELRYARPELAESLGRSVSISDSAAGLSASAIQANPRVVSGLAEVNTLSQQAVAAYAKLQAKIADGLPTLAAERALQKIIEKLREAQDSAEAGIKVILDADAATSAARKLADEIRGVAPTSMERLTASAREAAAAIERVSDATARAALQSSMVDIAGDIEALPAQVDPAARATQEGVIASRIAAVTSAAGSQSGGEERVAGLARRIASIDEAWALSVRGLPETERQIDDFFLRVLGDIGKLDAASRISLDPLIGEIRDLIASGAGTSRIAARLLELESAAEAAGGAGGAPRSQAPSELLMSPVRQIGMLENGVTSVVSQLERLPLPIRQHFLPAIQAAEQEFMRLRALGPAATAEEIERAANNMRTLEAATRRATQAQAFGDRLGGRNAQEFELNIQGQSLSGYQAQLQVLMRTLGAVSTEARGPAVQSFLRLQEAISSAFENGTLDAASTRRQIAALTQEAVRATASAAGVSRGRLGRDVSRAGDVGRQGFDRFSLALNQAAFAVDDFMSSTGGLEFKLRAISNNITQLAFVMGGTKGLFIGLGAVIAGQVVVSLVKWVNNGRTAEDQTKALNDSLARQKGLVEELAQAYKSLGDAIVRGTRSSGAEQGEEIGGQAEGVRAKLKGRRDERILGDSIQIQEERAEQVKLGKQLESETDVGRRIAITRSIEESKSAERDYARRLLAMPAPTAEQVQQQIAGNAQRVEDFERAYGGDRTAIPEVLRNIAARANVVGDPNPIGSQMQALRDAIEVQKGEAQEKVFGFPTPQAINAGAEIQRSQMMLDQLRNKLESLLDDAAVALVQSLDQAASSIRTAQADVADAIKRGVPAAGQFQAELNKLASEMDAALAELEAAQGEGVSVEDKQRMTESATARVAAVEGQRTRVQEMAREARLGRTFGGQRTEAALSALQRDERFANEIGVTANARGAMDAELTSRQAVEDADKKLAAAREEVAARERDLAASKSDDEKKAAAAALDAAQAKAKDAEKSRAAAQASLEFAQKASDAAASIAEFALSLEGALSRTRKIGESAVSASEQSADTFQREYTQNPLRAGAMEARDRAERRLIGDRARVETAQNALTRARSEAMDDPRMKAIREERERIQSEMKDAASAAAQGGPAEDQAKVEAQRNRLVALEEQEARILQDLTAKRRKELDAIAASIAAREQELEKSRKRNEEDPTVNRIRGAADKALADAERRASEAQERFVNNPTNENRQRRDEAAAQLESRRLGVQRFQDEFEAARKEIEANPELQENNRKLQEIAERRAQIAGQSAGRTLTQAEREELLGRGGLIDQESDLRRRNEEIKQSELSSFRFGVDLSQRRDARRAQADAGRDLDLTERERFRKDIEEGTGANIRARAAQIEAAEKERQLVLGKGEAEADAAAKAKSGEFIDKAISEQIKNVAPMLYDFGQERRNAELQGPSRARLDVSDVSTTQGRAELNRLFRGDDASKDVNLAELRKQTDQLQELISVVRDNPLPVADFQ